MKELPIIPCIEGHEECVSIVIRTASIVTIIATAITLVFGAGGLKNGRTVMNCVHISCMLNYIYISFAMSAAVRSWKRALIRLTPYILQIGG